MKDQLDSAINSYFRDLLNSHNFVLVDEQASGMGALKDFENSDLFVRLVNDKGIVSLELGPKTAPGSARDIALYKELRQPPQKGCWNLSLQEQAQYLEAHWDWFVSSLSPENQQQTLQALDRCARERAKTLFG